MNPVVLNCQMLPMKKPEPILIADLLPKLDRLLITLLKNLSEIAWMTKTIVPIWRVKDIALHLLDGNLRTLSMLRDNHMGLPQPNLNNYKLTVQYLNDLNASWIKATQRLSPKVIIDLLEHSGKAYCTYLQSLDPFSDAAFSVGWAGESVSKNWFHIAREYTEKWHHQQQIRLAVGKDDSLLEEEWFLPYLNTSIRALPHHYKPIQGTSGDLIHFIFKGKHDKSCFLKNEKNSWELFTEIAGHADSVVTIPDHIAWRIFTKGIRKDEALSFSTIQGNKQLGIHIFDMVAVMA